MCSILMSASSRMVRIGDTALRVSEQLERINRKKIQMIEIIRRFWTGPKIRPRCHIFIYQETKKR